MRRHPGIIALRRFSARGPTPLDANQRIGLYVYIGDKKKGDTNHMQIFKI
jgi:hypothetical protein